MTFSHLVSAFFTKHLISERRLAANTVASYSDCMKLLIIFACERFSIKPEQLDVSRLSRDLVIDFLDYLETTRNNQASTRNQRLTAIKTFFHFLAVNVPELMHLNETIQAIKETKTEEHPPLCLTKAEMDAILIQPDSSTLLGARDNAMLQLLYNSGARVQELADLKIGDLRFDTSPLVSLIGKGNKTRVVPLRGETVKAINYYLSLRPQSSGASDHLFFNTKGQAITRFGIGRRVAKYAEQAQRDCPSLCHLRVTPHVFRHTTALHLLDADNDIVKIQQWLGHADLNTTSAYLEISVERKRKALEKVPPPNCGTPDELPLWKEPGMMTFLTNLSRGAMLR